MKLENKPLNIAHMNNVGNAKEFTMKATAKSFEILSSSLYSNPIRAIIRELSTNAYDSHIEANNPEPFDIHLPTQMEPYFYIRDYGIGLTADQVENIYITYFDSNKTDSNDLVGGLGLGSKAPFSYTQNFTVTAVKNGIKSMFSAFINDDGIPSIVKMGELPTNEPTGVEIKFSVENARDFYKFADESSEVYKYFTMKPNFIGKKIEIQNIKYETMNVVPNVHIITSKHSYYSNNAIAVMGNIAYPINVPNIEKVFGSLAAYQKFEIQLDFSIGEVQFQASREGLHYTKNTIRAIGKKFKELDDSLYESFKSEMQKYDNKWTQTVAFYTKKNSNPIWKNSASRYLQEFKNAIFEDDISYGTDTFKDFNVNLISFKKNSNGSASRKPNWIPIVPNSVIFVENDTKVGATNRLKNHITKSDNMERFFLIVPLDNKKTIDYVGFYDSIGNPPESCKIKVSSLIELPSKQRVTSNRKNIGVMKLVNASTTSYSVDRKYKWDSVMIDDCNPNTTHYYAPLVGYSAQFDNLKVYDLKMLWNSMRESGLSGINDIQIYGVRKSDLDVVKEKTNWVNIEDYFNLYVNSLNETMLLPNILRTKHSYVKYVYNKTVSEKLIDQNSPYKRIASHVNDSSGSFDPRKAKYFVSKYWPHINFETLTSDAEKTATKLINTYPLLKFINTTIFNNTDIVDYVNFIDMKKE